MDHNNITMNFFKKLVLSSLLVLLVGGEVGAASFQAPDFWEENSATVIKPALNASGVAYDVLIEGDLQVDGSTTLSTIATGDVDLDGNSLIFDADGDTTITADTDDQIDVTIGSGSTILQLTRSTNDIAFANPSGALFFNDNIIHNVALIGGQTAYTSTYSTSGTSASPINGTILTMSPGYTGAAFTSVLSFDNAVAGVSTSYQTDGTYGSRPNGNRGGGGFSRGTTIGHNTGWLALASNGNVNWAQWMAATAPKANAENIGGIAIGFNSSSGGEGVGLYALYDNPSTKPYIGNDTRTALLADNAANAVDIAVFRDNNTDVVKISDGGTIDHTPVTFTNSSGVSTAQSLTATLNQTGTAGSVLELVSLTNTARGSGDHYFKLWQADGNDKFGLQSGASVFEIFSQNADDSDAEIYGLHESPTPDNEDVVFTVTGAGLDDADNELSFGSMQFIAESVDNTDAYGLIRFNLLDGGVLTPSLSISVDGVIAHSGFLVSGNLMLSEGTDLASANDMAMPNANVVNVTGTTQINTMGADLPPSARVPIYLIFGDSVTVKHGTSGAGAQFQLSGAADFAATAGDVLQVIFDGTYWREVSRTVI